MWNRGEGGAGIESATCCKNHSHPTKTDPVRRWGEDRYVEVFPCSLTAVTRSPAYTSCRSVCICCLLMSSFVHVLEGGKCKCMWVCVLLQTVRGCALWVFHLYRLYHQLGQFLSLCLINGLPEAPLCRELRSVCSCSFCTSYTEYTQTVQSSGTHIEPNRCAYTVGKRDGHAERQNSSRRFVWLQKENLHTFVGISCCFVCFLWLQKPR